MANVKIIIKGIAICYFKNNQFKVLFPFDGDHQVKLSLGGSVIKLGVKKCKIAVTGATSQVETPNFGHFLDITNSRTSHPAIEPVLDWENSGALLTVDGAKFSEFGPTFSRFGLDEKTVPPRETMPPVIIGYSGQLELEGTVILINVVSDTIQFPLSIVTNTEITFDNSCLNCPAPTQSADFDMIYSVIQEFGGNGRKLSLKRHPADMPVHPISGGDALPAGGTHIDSPNSIEQADNNPPRLAPGLPCNIVVASNSDNMP